MLALDRARACGCTALAIAAAVLAATPTTTAHADVVISPYLDVNAAGDIDTNRAGLGLAAGYYLLSGRLGFELDGEWHSHYFNDPDVAHLVPDGIDLNTRATQLMLNVVAPYPLRGRAGSWYPYGAAGVGFVRAEFDAVAFGGSTADDYDSTQLDLTFNAGAGVMHALTDHIGFRVDLRYYRVLAADDTPDVGYSDDYAFWRVSVGLVIGFPTRPW